MIITIAYFPLYTVVPQYIPRLIESVDTAVDLALESMPNGDVDVLWLDGVASRVLQKHSFVATVPVGLLLLCLSADCLLPRCPGVCFLSHRPLATFAAFHFLAKCRIFGHAHANRCSLLPCPSPSLSEFYLLTYQLLCSVSLM